MFDVEGFAVHVPPLAALRESDPEGVAAGERAGAEMTIAEAIALALPDAEPTSKRRSRSGEWYLSRSCRKAMMCMTTTS